ncbi:MAG: hypothetical protein KIT00_11965 [Rhodospirillales bacterium]|nr:hypothetical protein [Rhodospirillales bacterium]
MKGGEFLRTQMGAMISQGFAFDNVRENLGLKGVSEVWGGAETDDHPAWYFWLNTMQGAYRIRLMQAQNVDEQLTPVLRGVFSLKYYPSPCEPVFRRFSAQEQALIEGSCFDDTNTPRFDAQGQIPENLFNVGTIEIIRDLSSDQTFLRYSSLDQLRFHNESSPAHRGNGDTGLSVDNASRVRQLPVWDLGYPLFDAIVGLHAFLNRKAPKRVILSHQDGFEFIEVNEGLFEHRDTDAAAFKSILVTFFPENDQAPSPVEEAVTDDILLDPWIPILDSAAHRIHGSNGAHHHENGACDCCHAHDHTLSGNRVFLRSVKVNSGVWEIPLAFNEQWWVLADADQTANTMPCGCH